jgi:hypothetical protein
MLVCKTHPLCEESQYYCSQTYVMDTGHIQQTTEENNQWNLTFLSEVYG